MTALTALARIAPPLAAELAWRAWRRVGPPAAVHERDAATHARAHIQNLGPVVTYRWGTGPRVILLVHGWHSRASRFSAVIDALEGPDTTILAFDAPANGATPGRFVTVLDYVDAIEQLARRHGQIDTIIGHSFGVLASFIAVRESVRVRRLVAISGMYDAAQLIDEFSRRAGIAGAAKRGLRRRIERRTFPQVANPWRRFVSETDPTDGMPLLIVHDSTDTYVDPGQALLIADAHTGPVESLITTGLGHSRILGDPGVVARIADFAAAGIERAGRTRD
ncbi:hypothetical protein BH10ACT7_BH10ACT7_16300 [soil metagenome]